MSSTEIAPEAFGRKAAISVRRFSNEYLAESATRFDHGDGDVFEFLCECGDLSCRTLVKMTLADYRRCEPGSVVGHA